VSTSTDPVRQRVAAANPARPEAEPPGEVMAAAALLDVIDDRSGAMTHEPDSQEQGSSVARRRRRPSWAAAFAAGFIVVLFVGISMVLLANEGDPLDAVAPVTTTTPTTVPDATMTSVPDMAPFVTISADQVNYPLPDDEAHGIAIADGRLWATTEGGIIRWDLEERRGVQFTSDDGLPFDDGFSGKVAAAPDGTIWVVTWNQGLAMFDGTEWSEPAGYDQVDIVNPRCTRDEECLNPVTAMAVAPDGLLSLAVGEETLLQFDGVDWRVLLVNPDETHGGSAWATDMAVASDGTLWVASGEDLLAYDGEAWVRFTAADGLPSGAVSSVAVAPNGDVWVGTTDLFEMDPSGGVARFDGESWTVFDEADGLYGNDVTALTVGPDGTVWAAHASTDGASGARDLAAGGVSRFDGTAWSSTTIVSAEMGFGWGGAAVDDTGTLWVTSRFGAIGFDGAEATVLRLPNGTRPPINTAAFTLPSQLPGSDKGPLEWRWDPVGGLSDEAKAAQKPVEGTSCFGSSSGQALFTVVELEGRGIDVRLGYRSTPNIVITDEAGTVTDVGNPFGEHAWLCSVETTETLILAVGSGVFWSDDGVDWSGIEAFEEFAGGNADGSDLIWAAAGSGGYMVLGRHGDSRRLAWFSEDLESWYEIPIEDELDGLIWWGWGGPSGVAVEKEPVIVFYDGAWIGTRRED
jgi:hypothetical protein